ncbi:MAG: DUF4402 domain-containing protein [Bacteroidota bacterium]|nr:DUF4402 domain-containing protein [Bacteroidota bacterium]MDP4233318.1 DUF4402 domain-containing protein [Bacteroidota bacterium]MDP4242062.1 DUF4402 domain-containing protein [Bacteroidota bacterium]MDP4288660.1 DUF4402 domain-containing protein [Bacteroidota bacterium]
MKITIKLMAVAAMLGLAGSAMAQSSDNALAHIGFRLAVPIHIAAWTGDGQNPSYLDFGTLISQNSTLDGSATLTPWALGYSGPFAYGSSLTNLTNLNPVGDMPHSSYWQITGEPGALFTLSINGTTVYGSDGIPKQMTLDPNPPVVSKWRWFAQFPNPANDKACSIVTMPGSGSLVVAIAGTLTIPYQYTAVGDHSADFPVTVYY